jgi:hypothetical protein
MYHKPPEVKEIICYQGYCAKSFEDNICFQGQCIPESYHAPLAVCSKLEKFFSFGLVEQKDINMKRFTTGCAYVFFGKVDAMSSSTITTYIPTQLIGTSTFAAASSNAASTAPVTSAPIRPDNSEMIQVYGDYNGDGSKEMAFWIPKSGNWYIQSSGGKVILNGLQYGASTMIPVAGDYDGDGTYDLALWNKPDGMWYIYSIAKNTNLAWAKPYGASTMVPKSVDYDKDGVYDLALRNFTDGKWYIYSLVKNTNLVWGDANVIVSSAEPSSNYDTAMVSWEAFLSILRASRE